MITGIKTTVAIPPIPISAGAAPTIGSIIGITSTSVWSAIILPINESGAISKILLRMQTSNVSNIYDVRVESVSASGNPSGTLFSAGSEATGITGINSLADITAILNTPANVSPGDVVAIVIKATTFIGNASVAVFTDGSAGDFLPVVTSSSNSGGTWGARNGAPMVGIEYSDGSYPYISGIFPINSFNTTVLTDASSPILSGNKITLPFRSRISGFWFWADNDADVTIQVYSSDGQTVLASVNYDADLPYASSAALVHQIYLSTPIEVDANDSIYVVIVAAAASVSLYDLNAFNAAAMSGISGEYCKRVVSNSSTPAGSGDFNEDTDRQSTIGIIVNGIEFDGGAAAEYYHASA